MCCDWHLFYCCNGRQRVINTSFLTLNVHTSITSRNCLNVFMYTAFIYLQQLNSSIITVIKFWSKSKHQMLSKCNQISYINLYLPLTFSDRQKKRIIILVIIAINSHITNHDASSDTYEKNCNNQQWALLNGVSKFLNRIQTFSFIA